MFNENKITYDYRERASIEVVSQLSRQATMLVNPMCMRSNEH